MVEALVAKRPIPPRAIVLNAVSSFVGNLADALAFIVLIPFVLATLGVEQYGLWALVWAMVSLMALIDMGFGTAVVKFVADARGRDDARRMQHIVATLFWVYVGQMLVLFAMVGSVALAIDHIFTLPATAVPTARRVMLIVGGGYATSVPLVMFRGVLIGHQKQRVANAYKIGGTLLYFSAVLAILPRAPHLETLAALNLLTTVVPYVAITLHARRTLRPLSVAPRHFDTALLREVWGFSLYSLIINVAMLIATRVDTFVIHSALGLTAVAVYALAMRISDQAQMFCLQISRTLTPVVAELHSAGEEARLRAVWLRGTKVATALAVPLLVGCAVLARPLIVSWTGEDFLGAVPVLQILLGAALINVIHSNSHNTLSMRGEQRFLAYALLASQIANLLLSLVLVRVWGIVGVALATLVTYLPFQALFIQRRAQRLQRVSSGVFYRTAVLPSLVPMLLTVGAMWLVQAARPLGSLWAVAMVELAATLFFVVVFFRLGLSRSERLGAVAIVHGGLSGKKRPARDVEVRGS